MTPTQQAQDLVNQYRNILMDEDTECGHEILCTAIAVRCAKVAVNTLLMYVEDVDGYWRDVVAELDKV